MSARVDVKELVDWILAEGCKGDDLGAILAGVSDRLAAMGIPLYFATLHMPTIDPTAAVLQFLWRPDQAPTTTELSLEEGQGAAFRRSPIHYVIERDLGGARWKLEDPETVKQFALFKDLHTLGVTEYVLRLVSFGQRRKALQGLAFTLATNRPGGFADAEIEVVDRLLPALSVVAYRIGLSRVATETLGAYLGPSTGARVMQGVIRRGDSQVISAALLLADLRGFTTLADRAPATEVVAWLNQHLECVGDSVTAQGGEILKFLGDGLLAIFPSEQIGAERACNAAVNAAIEACRQNAALNLRRKSTGGPALDLSTALHFGDVVYGNIGTARRLDFTIVGPAVNEVSRMEALGKALGRELLLSQSVADRCGHKVISVGAHELRGIAGHREMYTVASASTG
ncbi:MAG: adenylate/guanylate cyclase domain-containing protein [Alphaproteobacteria bacterium]|nr:adenylate/guanylate cyclase domain-containing protein [Alphaproteobacteria bacterium]